MKIEVNQQGCVGSGQCVLAADELFDQDDDGIVILLRDHAGPGLRDSAQRAASLCPARAITLSD
ncbi:ferredoxin [Sinosporangium siamense]|uniref:Ferredoxin n=1 Tax=Sinosporangium siamense TaxID=1367973 RepID=A0A919RK65_9ACTN|nr:ferredoxin [Sinosporangium siamense]GII95108.1 ferredoxin [Sinosporangium siamense]